MAMPNVLRWEFTGGKTSVIQGLTADAEISAWYARVIAFVSKIAESPDFEVVDNGYGRVPGVLVTDGIAGFFRGKRFEVWSDVPGELIFGHCSMGSRMANELIQRLEALWAMKT